MKDNLTDRVEFDFIRYANCWEDADILVEALQVNSHDKVLSIASAGDNSFALLQQGPELVVAVDVNPVQLYLCELKKAAFTLSDHEDFIEFLGFAPNAHRLKTYHRIREQLSPEARDWWNNHTDIIENGVILQGKFERYFSFFRNKLLPLIHSKKNIRNLFLEKPAAEQENFYHKKWNTWRWRLFFRIFFSRRVMGKYGRDPEFMKEVKLSVSDYIFGKAENHLLKKGAQENLYLHHILTGHFKPRLPYYARPEHFQSIKQNINRLEVFHGYAEDAIKKYGQFSVFNLSNIFEYLSVDVTKQVAENLSNGATEKARFAYWNLMVARNLAALLPDRFSHDVKISAELSAKDNGFFYRSFNLNYRR